jgi:hypothetical protein
VRIFIIINSFFLIRNKSIRCNNEVTFHHKVGDVILAVDGQNVEERRQEDADVLARMIRQYRAGTEAKFSIWREAGENKKTELTVVLEAQPTPVAEMPEWEDIKLEYTARDVAFDDRVRLQLPQNLSGVLVSSVVSAGWSYLAGLRSDDLSVGGVGSAKGFLDVLRPVFMRSGLTIRADPTGRGPSDHASFYGVGVPVLFIYTGNHSEYHTPDDKGYTVNPQGAAKIIALAGDIVRTIAAKPEKLEFQSTDGAKAADRGYAKVRLGVMPAMGGVDDRPAKAPKTGVMVDSVSPETSAAEAGIKAGDVLLAWNGELLENTQAMMARLRDHKPGDKVKVKLWRDGKETEVEVTLKASKPQE